MKFDSPNDASRAATCSRRAVNLALASTFAASLLSLSTRSFAAGYPERPLKLVLGFAPGGATDSLARVMALKSGEKLGQQVVVENRPGAATRIGVEAVQKAPADGYIIGLATAVTTTFPLMFDGAAFVPGKDFMPISMLGRAPSFLVVRKDLPAKNYKEFVAYGKSSGKLSMGHPGNGSNPHIAGLALCRAAGMPVNPIPYKGTSPTAQAVAAGDVDFAMLEHAAVRPFLEKGLIRSLAVTEPRRSQLQPDVPTGQEVGITSDIEGLTPWFMMFAPAGTPEPAIGLLNKTFREVLGSRDVQDTLALVGIEPESGSPAEATAYFNAQRVRITRLVHELNLSLKT